MNTHRQHQNTYQVCAKFSSSAILRAGRRRIIGDGGKQPADRMMANHGPQTEPLAQPAPAANQPDIAALIARQRLLIQANIAQTDNAIVPDFQSEIRAFLYDHSCARSAPQAPAQSAYSAHSTTLRRASSASSRANHKTSFDSGCFKLDFTREAGKQHAESPRRAQDWTQQLHRHHPPPLKQELAKRLPGGFQKVLTDKNTRLPSAMRKAAPSRSFACSRFTITPRPHTKKRVSSFSGAMNVLKGWRVASVF